MSKSSKNPLATKSRLSDDHKAVLDAWFAGGCASKRKAMLQAGYSVTTASANPASIFGRPDVMAEIRRRQARLEKKADTSQDRIIAEYAKIAYANLGDLLEIEEDGSAWVDLTQLTSEHKAALAQIDTEEVTITGESGSKTIRKNKVKFHDKKAALDALARINGMFKDKLDVAVGLTLVQKIDQARQMLQPKTIEGTVE